MSDPKDLYSGGCQCGAVRFRVEGALDDASICHCRMCQKAFGGFYAPLASVRNAKLVWTRGERAVFQSSNHVRRGFCRDCGTPLTYEAPDGIALAIGAFDHPEMIVPDRQYGLEEKLPYTDGLSKLPGTRTEQDLEEEPFLGTLVNYQHPDHDTAVWPEGKSE